MENLRMAMTWNRDSTLDAYRDCCEAGYSMFLCQGPRATWERLWWMFALLRGGVEFSVRNPVLGLPYGAYTDYCIGICIAGETRICRWQRREMDDAMVISLLQDRRERNPE